MHNLVSLGARPDAPITDETAADPNGAGGAAAILSANTPADVLAALAATIAAEAAPDALAAVDAAGGAAGAPADEQLPVRLRRLASRVLDEAGAEPAWYDITEPRGAEWSRHRAAPVTFAGRLYGVVGCSWRSREACAPAQWRTVTGLCTAAAIALASCGAPSLAHAEGAVPLAA